MSWVERAFRAEPVTSSDDCEYRDGTKRGCSTGQPRADRIQAVRQKRSSRRCGGRPL